MKLCLLYISVATTFLAICISSAQDNEQTVSELTNGMVESEGLVAAHFVALRNIQLNFTNLLNKMCGKHPILRNITHLRAITRPLILLSRNSCINGNLQKYMARMMYPGDLFQPNAASLSWFKEEVRYYTEAAS
ncbi:unnamed protein product [Heterobilharzia americana]|nr:unnamed protein product [Heterobilharzia americana]